MATEKLALGRDTLAPDTGSFTLLVLFAPDTISSPVPFGTKPSHQVGQPKGQLHINGVGLVNAAHKLLVFSVAIAMSKASAGTPQAGKHVLFPLMERAEIMPHKLPLGLLFDFHIVGQRGVVDHPKIVKENMIHFLGGRFGGKESSP